MAERRSYRDIYTGQRAAENGGATPDPAVERPAEDDPPPLRTKRKPAERDLDDERIAAMIHEGFSYRQIAAELRISKSTVERDAKRLRAGWRDQAQLDIKQAVADELALLSHLQAEAMAEWHRSKGKITKKTSSRKQQGLASAKGSEAILVPTEEQARLQEEQRLGDPRYLDVVLRVHERRSRLTGLEVTTADASDARARAQEEIAEAQRDRLVQQLRDGVVAPAAADGDGEADRYGGAVSLGDAIARGIVLAEHQKKPVA